VSHLDSGPNGADTQIDASRVLSGLGTVKIVQELIESCDLCRFDGLIRDQCSFKRRKQRSSYR
jgi:hypothetical protein